MNLPRLSIFNLVSAMNVAFGNPQGDPHAISGKRVNNQVKGIESELNELKAAINGNDITAMRDATCDIMVFALGLYHVMGYDADLDMRDVIEALYTRFCKDESQLERTCAKYNALGIKYNVVGNFPTVCLKSSEDQQMPEYPAGKFLKCIDYRTPEFYQLSPPADVIAEMARQRQELEAKQKAQREDIDRKVNEYRVTLEQEAFGLPAFDGNANQNTVPGGEQEIALRVSHERMFMGQPPAVPRHVSTSGFAQTVMPQRRGA